jgi:hypothetical protein
LWNLGVDDGQTPLLTIHSESVNEFIALFSSAESSPDPKHSASLKHRLATGNLHSVAPRLADIAGAGNLALYCERRKADRRERPTGLPSIT